MYNSTRQEAADTLWISTRSVDRYIKSGKLRAQKRGKVVYVNENDIQNIAGWNTTKQHVIIEKWSSQSTSNQVVTPSQSAGLDQVYSDLREEVKKKDAVIQELSMRVGRAEEIAKNSVSLVDFKKSQFLLEESKNSLGEEVWNLQEKTKELEKDLKYEKNTNIILIIFVVILLVISGVIWFLKI